MTDKEADLVGRLVEAAWRRQEMLVMVLLMELRRLREQKPTNG